MQRRPGAVRFKVNADVGGVLVGGRLVASVGKGNNELGVSDMGGLKIKVSLPV